MHARLISAVSAAVATATIMAVVSCGEGGSAPANEPTLNPEPPISEQEAIEIAKEQHDDLLETINFYGHANVKIRTGSMLLRELQELTNTELFTEGSPRLDRQIWAVQIGGSFGEHDVPYNIRNGIAITAVDAENGDIWLRARYNAEILINPDEE